jgi:hypothetical protein
MSILSELKKLTGKQNAKVVSEALPDETGGSIAPLICTATNGTFDKTMGEIQEAVLNGRPVLFYVSGDPDRIYTLLDLTPVFYYAKMGRYSCGIALYSGYYDATGETEAAALAAYPTRSA